MLVIEMTNIPEGASEADIRSQSDLAGKKIENINRTGTTAIITVDDGVADFAQQKRRLAVMFK